MNQKVGYELEISIMVPLSWTCHILWIWVANPFDVQFLDIHFKGDFFH